MKSVKNMSICEKLIIIPCTVLIESLVAAIMLSTFHWLIVTTGNVQIVSETIIQLDQTIKMLPSIRTHFVPDDRRTIEIQSKSIRFIKLEDNGLTCQVTSYITASTIIKDQILLLHFYEYWNWFPFIFKFNWFLKHSRIRNRCSHIQWMLQCRNHQ